MTNALHIQAVARYAGFFDDFASFMTGLTRFDEMDVASIDDLVSQAKTRVLRQGARIGLLEIFAHGSASYIAIGDKDHLHAFVPKKEMPRLASLAPHFAPRGAVSLQVCKAGQLREVITELAVTLGVPVYANTGDVYPNLPGDGDGELVVARPDRSVSQGGSLRRPNATDAEGAVRMLAPGERPIVA